MNIKRFRKPPKNFADDYVATILWADGESSQCSLSSEEYVTTNEDAQYLPQKFIEETCNDIDKEFQDEIDKVIFSYVDRTERGESQNLHELVQQKSRPIELIVQADLLKIHEINTKINQEKIDKESFIHNKITSTEIMMKTNNENCLRKINEVKNNIKSLYKRYILSNYFIINDVKIFEIYNLI